MFLEWWMIGILALIWIISMISHGRTSYESGTLSGVEAMLASLDEQGYIRITDQGDIIGLCNRDHENFN